MMQHKHILIGHGAGGKLSRQLIIELFIKYFHSENSWPLNDASVVKTSEYSAFTTDSYVIDPVFFPGGNIGKLAVCGTVNDLLVSGSDPDYLSAGFIIEEGFPIGQLEEIVKSMAEEARKCNVSIVTGDTKVVKKGQCDKLYINTAGIGHGLQNMAHLWKSPEIKPGDKIIVSGYLGDHAIAVLAARNAISFEKEVISDVAALSELLLPLYAEFGKDIRFVRDLTRGGLATVLNEVCEEQNFGFELNESNIPVRCEVLGICEVFGFDPLYLANEGKVVLIVSETAAQSVLYKMKSLTEGQNAAISGEVTEKHTGRLVLNSVIDGSRIVDMLTGEMLPRIC